MVKNTIFIGLSDPENEESGSFEAPAPLCATQKIVPIGMPMFLGVRYVVMGTERRVRRSLEQHHVGLLWRLVSLLVVTQLAANDAVSEGRDTPLCSGQYVVDGDLRSG